MTTKRERAPGAVHPPSAAESLFYVVTIYAILSAFALLYLATLPLAAVGPLAAIGIYTLGLRIDARPPRKHETE